MSLNKLGKSTFFLIFFKIENYEILSLKPSCGLKQGKTELHIYGNNFIPRKRIKVTFKCNKDIRHSPGQAISQNEIVCKVPEFPYCCTVSVEIINDNISTKNGRKFLYYDEIYIINVLPKVISQECI